MLAVRRLLARADVDVNQAGPVRVGVEGEGGWRERAGRRGGGAERSVRVTGAQHAWQGGGCERSRAVHISIGVRGCMGMEAVSREDGGTGGGGRLEGREGVVLGWR